MGRQANSLERGLASMTSCPQCGLQLPEGSSFCYQCGSHVGEGDLVVPRLGADAPTPEFGLAGAERIPRFTPHAADEPTCRFCKGPLDLDGEFCEQCGAPVSEAAPSRWLKHAAVAQLPVSTEKSQSMGSAADPGGPAAANLPAPPTTVSSLPTPSAPGRSEGKTSRTNPLTIAVPAQVEHRISPDGKSGKLGSTMPAPAPEMAQAALGPEFVPNTLPVEPHEVIIGQLPKTVVAPLPEIAASGEIAGTQARTNPIISVPRIVPVRGEAVSPALPKKSCPIAVPSAASLTGSPAAKATSSPATLVYASSPSVPPRNDEKALRARPLNIPPPPRAHKLGLPATNTGNAAKAFAAPPPTVRQATTAQVFALSAPAAEVPTVVVGQLGKTVATLLRQNAALYEIAAPMPGSTPTVSAPLILPVAGETAFPASPRKTFPFILVGGIATALLAVSVVAGWYILHRKSQGSRLVHVAVPQVTLPTPPVVTAPPTAEPAAPSPAIEVPEERPQSVTPARKPRRVKVIARAQPAAATPAPDPKAAQLVSFQNLALDACAKGNYVEPRDANAIAYSQRALALDHTNGYTRTILDNSIKGAEFQAHQAILAKNFTNAQRIADLLAQLLPNETSIAGLRADLATAEKAEEESRRASQVPATVLSFRVFHTHSGKGTGDKGAYCRGTLSVAGDRLKYVGETATDAQVHNFDFACSAVEIKKNPRVAFWEKGFHVRTTSGNLNFLPEDGSSSNIRALASACSQ
jgi:hypothetical protein